MYLAFFTSVLMYISCIFFLFFYVFFSVFLLLFFVFFFFFFFFFILFVLFFFFFFFFFSSRRRHTRCSRDWSSDVCSSDLPGLSDAGPTQPHVVRRRSAAHQARDRAVQGARRRDAARPETSAHAVQIGRASCRERV